MNRGALDDLSKNEISIYLIVSQTIIMLSALITGWFLFDSFFWYIPLLKFSKEYLLIGLVLGLIVVLLNIIISNLIPKGAINNDETNRKLFKDRNIMELFLIALVTAVCEEILFRGATQIYFGIVVSTIVFTLAHIRYLKYWYSTSFVIGVSILLGLVFEYYDHMLLPVIIMHFTINFIGGLLIRYFPNGIKVNINLNKN